MQRDDTHIGQILSIYLMHRRLFLLIQMELESKATFSIMRFDANVNSFKNNKQFHLKAISNVHNK